MRKFRKVMTLFLTLALLLSMTVASASAVSFSDVPEGKWYSESVMRWADAGIINGYTDGTFKPTANVTRAEFAKIIASTLGLTEQAENIFEDVPEGKWYTAPVLACVKAGIVNGYNENGKTLFKPSNNITRQEAMKMYVAALQLSGGEEVSLDQFGDSADVSKWAQGFVKTILSYGAVEGNTQNNLDPKGNITRAETAVILDRLAGVYVSEDGTISTTTAKQASKTGNLVVVHNAYDGNVTACVDVYGAVTVIADNVVVEVWPQDYPNNTKTTAVLVNQQVIEVAKEESVEIAPDGQIIPMPETEITLWTYPIGNWSNPQMVDMLIEKFVARYPGITVNVEYLNYMDGDEKMDMAIAAGVAPDVILEGPERLVNKWGKFMVDLSDIWLDGFHPNVAEASTAADGSRLMFPQSMTVHCMAINKTVFEAAGAMQYIDVENRTWTTENFCKAVLAVYDAGYENVGAVYCGGQGGDQGTRALVTNLCDGSFTNADHTAYTFNNEKNLAALEYLLALKGISFMPDMVGGDEIAMFRNGDLQMSFCWNLTQQAMNDEKTDNGDEIMFLAFPSEDGIPELQGGVWGFGALDNGNQEKIEAAKLFIRFVCLEEYGHGLMLSQNAPARPDQHDFYEGFMLNWEYDVLMKYFGDYYQVTPNWSQARNAWWNMLQDVAEGTPLDEASALWNAIANDGLN